jgi:hypothetical protein
MRPGLQLGEEAHVLDGDDGLIRKGFEESDLLVREGHNVTTPYRDRPECRLPAHQWYGQERPVPDGRVLILGINGNVVNVDHAAFEYGTAPSGVARRPPRVGPPKVLQRNWLITTSRRDFKDVAIESS